MENGKFVKEEDVSGNRRRLCNVKTQRRLQPLINHIFWAVLTVPPLISYIITLLASGSPYVIGSVLVSVLLRKCYSLIYIPMFNHSRTIQNYIYSCIIPFLLLDICLFNIFFNICHSICRVIKSSSKLLLTFYPYSFTVYVGRRLLLGITQIEKGSNFGLKSNAPAAAKKLTQSTSNSA